MARVPVERADLYSSPRLRISSTLGCIYTWYQARWPLPASFKVWLSSLHDTSPFISHHALVSSPTAYLWNALTFFKAMFPWLIRSSHLQNCFTIISFS